MPLSKLSLRKLLILIASMTALAPLAIDAYLPAIPTIATYIGTSIHDVELSLSLFLIGFSMGQLLGGPASDHFGRRLTVFSGLLIFVIGTLGIILSNSLSELLIYRVIQAFGGGIAVVNSNAIIRDISSGKESAKNLSHVALIMMLAPLLAPLIGSSILHLANWQWIFVFLFVYALIVAIMIYLHIPETRIIQTEKTSTLQRYLMVLKNQHALAYLFALCCSYGGMFAFITGSPSVYMGYFGISEQAYPLFFGANILSMLTANRLNVLLLRYYQPDQILSLGQLLQFISGIGLLSYVFLANTVELGIVVTLIVIFIGTQGFIVSNATASTIELFPHNSGTASALLGASGFAIGALAGTFVGLMGDGTPLPMIFIMVTCSLLGISLRFIFQRKSTNIISPKSN
jgi:DHA1 family bicyclomycin/chloramphenicol resistance-like MFS transporter